MILVSGGVLMGKGITVDIVVQAAIQVIERNGLSNFSMRELADQLEIKTASLYNHVISMEKLYTQVGLYAIRELKEEELLAIEGKNGDDAIKALAEAYYFFGKNHPELYKVIMMLHIKEDKILEESFSQIIEPLIQVLSDYPLNETEMIQWQRVLRSIMHGFIAQEEAGFFGLQFNGADKTYETAIQCYIDRLHTALKEGER